MKLDLSQFRGESEHLDRNYAQAAFPWSNEEFRLGGPVSLVGDVRRDGQKFTLVGRLKTVLESDCSRCAEPYPVPVDADLELTFLPAAENTGEPEQEVGEDDLGVSFYRDDVIDLAEVMREQFYLALPMKPLCGEQCQGLCPVCGINRNRDTCRCESTWVDPRMDALRRLRDSH
jgi:uncharacterized protein